MRRQSPQVDRLRIALARIGDATIVLALGYVGELHAHGRRDRLAERNRLAVGDRGQEGDRAARRSARRGANDPLVELVGEPHGEQGRALRQNGRIELRGTLRHDPERGAVLPPFLGDPADRLPGRPEGLPAVGWNIAVRLFAQHVDFIRPRAPECDFERQPREHRDDRVDDLVGQARKLDDGDRQASSGYAKEARDDLGDIVLDHQPAKHEPKPRIAVEPLEPVAQRPEIGTGEALIEHAEPVLDDGDDVDDAEGRRRIGGDRNPFGHWLAPHRAGRGRRPQFDKVLCLGGADDFVKRVPFVGVRQTAAEDDVGQFVESKHPERQFETV